ncbi:hypothetical protein ACWDUL_33675 [Nocardia niigatensis]
MNVLALVTEIIAQLPPMALVWLITAALLVFAALMLMAVSRAVYGKTTAHRRDARKIVRILWGRLDEEDD